MNSMERYYNLLGLTPGASAEEIKHAYRDLAKVWHPDRFPNDPHLQQKAQEKLKEINAAYKILQPPKSGFHHATYRARPRSQQSDTQSYSTNSQSDRGKTQRDLSDSNKGAIGIVIVRLIAILLLVLAFRHNPYGYYILLRWIICASFAYCAIKAYDRRNESWAWIFGISAAIYNPIATLHLGRSVWAMVNTASIIMILFSFAQGIKVNKAD